MRSPNPIIRRSGRTAAYVLLGIGSAMILSGLGLIEPRASFGIPEPITMPDIRGTQPHTERSVLRLGPDAPASPLGQHPKDAK